jgi:hypothetical protein
MVNAIDEVINRVGGMLCKANGFPAAATATLAAAKPKHFTIFCFGLQESDGLE